MGNEHAGSRHYWTQLSESGSFSDSEGKWVHALPVGSFQHPVHGTVTLTLDRIKRFAQNVKEGVRGIDPYVNYDHREKSGEAAGWVKDADARPDGLWLFVEWTKEAARKLSDREYRYWSTEFIDKWKDPHNGKEYEDVIIGGALTNVPFLKNLVPVNLSELTQEDEMDRAKLIKLLGLPDEATDEEVEAKLTELNKGKELDLSKAEITVGEDGTIKVTHPDAEGEITHKVEAPKAKEKEEESDAEKELAKLAEDNPAVAKLLSETKTLKDDVAQLQAATRLSEVTTQLNELGATEKKGLPPAAAERFRKLMVRMPKQFSDEIHDALVELFKVGIVELGEQTGKTRKGSQPEGDPVKKFMDVIDELREKDDKLDYRSAVAQAKRENPELFYEYQEAVAEGNVQLTEQE